MLKSPRVFLFALKNSLTPSAHFSSSPASRNAAKKVCIVGSGPAGFYFAQNLLKKIPDVSVDMYEKLPVPYGLVRYGVAPDHPEVKNVISTFEKTASNANFRFVGNVTLGSDVTFSELKDAYHAVVLTYGCSEDKELGIPGESLPNVISARKFVGWYNGLPEDRDLSVDLSADSVVVLGQGNVAVDVSRILLSPIDMLKVTDITEYSLEALARSKVKTVHLVGRRGPLQAAFTIKEFREMTKLPQVQTVFDKNHFAGTENIIPTLPRARKRLSELMVTTAESQKEGDKFFRPTFLHKPVEILNSSKSRAEAVKFELNRIDHEKGIAEGLGTHNTLECGLVLRSIGYKGTSPDQNIPFDSKKGTVINEKGNSAWKVRVRDLSPSGVPRKGKDLTLGLPPGSLHGVLIVDGLYLATGIFRDYSFNQGVYSAGWIHRGPTGVILSTMTDAFEQSNVLIEDISSGKLEDSSKPGYSAVCSILKSKGIVAVDFDGWKRIDQEEVRRGSTAGKPREKIVDIAEMLSIGGC